MATTVSGQVTDDNGAPLEGIEVRVTDPDTGDALHTSVATTDAQGRYSITIALSGDTGAPVYSKDVLSTAHV